VSILATRLLNSIGHLPICPGMPENRLDTRIAMGVRIILRWVDESGNPRMSHGQLENMSDGGMGIRVDDPIHVGAKLDVRTPFGNFRGTLLHSRKDGQDYFLGIKREGAGNPEHK